MTKEVKMMEGGGAKEGGKGDGREGRFQIRRWEDYGVGKDEGRIGEDERR